MNRLCIQLVTLSVVGSFIADPGTASAIADRLHSTPSLPITIPRRCGRITDFYAARPESCVLSRESNTATLARDAGPKTQDPRLVVLIQDLHGHPGAQRNIAEILKHVARQLNSSPLPPKASLAKGGMGEENFCRHLTVLVEGASGPFDVSLLRNVQNRWVRKETVQHFLNEAKLTGAEVAAIESETPMHLWGVDDKDLYLQNLEAFYKASTPSPPSSPLKGEEDGQRSPSRPATRRKSGEVWAPHPHPHHPAWREYYRIAKERDIPLTLNTLSHLDLLSQTAAPPSVTALVAGGYHTEGLSRILRANRTPYVVVSPTIQELGAERIHAARLRALAELARQQSLAALLVFACFHWLHADAEITLTAIGTFTFAALQNSSGAPNNSRFTTLLLTPIKYLRKTLPPKEDKPLLLTLLGLAVGFLSPLLGIGGGVLMVPALQSRYFRHSWAKAVATSLAAVVPLSAFSAMCWFLADPTSVDLRTAVLLGIASIGGARIGAKWLDRFSDRHLTEVFAVILALIGLHYLHAPWPVDLFQTLTAVRPTPLRDVMLMGAGLGIGTLSSLVGVGGGFLLVPVLHFGFGLLQTHAIATSLLTVLITTVSAASAPAHRKNWDFKTAGALAASALLGASIGTLLIGMLRSMALEIIFGIFMLAASLFFAHRILMGNTPPTSLKEDKPLTDVALGHRIADQVVDYLASLDAHPVYTGKGFAELKALVDRYPAPVDPGAVTDILSEIERIQTENMRLNRHYLGHEVTTPQALAVFVNLLIDRWNLDMSGEVPPAARYTEDQTIRWLCDMVGYQEAQDLQGRRRIPGGMMTSGGTSANLAALLLARNEALSRMNSEAAARTGRRIQTKDLVILTSAERHYSVEKVAGYIGIGSENVINIRVDDQLRMDPEDLRRQIEEVERQGKTVAAIVATAGTTETGNVDPLPEIVQIAKEKDIWLHVDAAHGGAFALTSDTHLRKVMDAMKEADSVTIDPHKMLNIPYNSGALLVRDRRALSWLEATGGNVSRFFGPRRFDALKVWAALKWMGLETLSKKIDYSLDTALYFFSLFERDEDFETLSTPETKVFTVRYVPQALKQELEGAIEAEDHDKIQEINQRLTELNRSIQKALQESGRVWLSYTTMPNSRYTPWQGGKEIGALRIAVYTPFATRESLEESFTIIRSIAAETAAIQAQLLGLGQLHPAHAPPSVPVANEEVSPPDRSFQNYFVHPDNQESMRKLAHDIVDIATGPGEGPTKEPLPETPAELEKAFGGWAAPRTPAKVEDILEALKLLHRCCMNGKTTHPPWIASLASVVYAAVNANLIAWEVSPWATLVEMKLAEDIARLSGYKEPQERDKGVSVPLKPRGIFTSGLSMSLLTTLLVARTGWLEQHTHDLDTQPVIITSQSQEALVRNVAEMIGIEQDHVQAIDETDGNTDFDALQAALAKTEREGKSVLAVNLCIRDPSDPSLIALTGWMKKAQKPPWVNLILMGQARDALRMEEENGATRCLHNLVESSASCVLDLPDLFAMPHGLGVVLFKDPADLERLKPKLRQSASYVLREEDATTNLGAYSVAGSIGFLAFPLWLTLLRYVTRVLLVWSVLTLAMLLMGAGHPLADHSSFSGWATSLGVLLKALGVAMVVAAVPSLGKVLDWLGEEYIHWNWPPEEHDAYAWDKKLWLEYNQNPPAEHWPGWIERLKREEKRWFQEELIRIAKETGFYVPAFIEQTLRRLVNVHKVNWNDHQMQYRAIRLFRWLQPQIPDRRPRPEDPPLPTPQDGSKFLLREEVQRALAHPEPPAPERRFTGLLSEEEVHEHFDYHADQSFRDHLIRTVAGAMATSLERTREGFGISDTEWERHIRDLAGLAYYAVPGLTQAPRGKIILDRQSLRNEVICRVLSPRLNECRLNAVDLVVGFRAVNTLLELPDSRLASYGLDGLATAALQAALTARVARLGASPKQARAAMKQDPIYTFQKARVLPDAMGLLDARLVFTVLRRKTENELVLCRTVQEIWRGRPRWFSSESITENFHNLKKFRGFLRVFAQVQDRLSLASVTQAELFKILDQQPTLFQSDLPQKGALEEYARRAFVELLCQQTSFFKGDRETVRKLLDFYLKTPAGGPPREEQFYRLGLPAMAGLLLLAKNTANDDRRYKRFFNLFDLLNRGVAECFVPDLPHPLYLLLHQEPRRIQIDILHIDAPSSSRSKITMVGRLDTVGLSQVTLQQIQAPSDYHPEDDPRYPILMKMLKAEYPERRNAAIEPLACEAFWFMARHRRNWRAQGGVYVQEDLSSLDDPSEKKYQGTLRTMMAILSIVVQVRDGAGEFYADVQDPENKKYLSAGLGLALGPGETSIRIPLSGRPEPYVAVIFPGESYKDRPSYGNELARLWKDAPWAAALGPRASAAHTAAGAPGGNSTPVGQHGVGQGTSLPGFQPSRPPPVPSTPRQAAVTAGLLAAVGIALATFGWPLHPGMARAAVFAAAMVFARFGAGYAVAGYRGLPGGPKASRDPPDGTSRWLWLKPFYRLSYFFLDFFFAFLHGHAPIATLQDGRSSVHARGLSYHQWRATHLHESIHKPFEGIINRFGPPEQRGPWKRAAVWLIRVISEFMANVLTVLALPFIRIVKSGPFLSPEEAWLPHAEEMLHLIEEKLAGRGGIVSLDGASGSGKSTLLRAIQRLSRTHYRRRHLQVLNLDKHMRHRMWRHAVQKLVASPDLALTPEEEILITDADRALIQQGSSELAYPEEFFWKNGVIWAILNLARAGFDEPEQSFTLTYRAPAYNQDTKTVQLESTLYSLAPGDVLLVEGKYANRKRFSDLYDICFRLDARDDEAREQFEARTRKLELSEKATRQMRFFDRVLWPCWASHEQRTAPQIHYRVDLRNGVQEITSPEGQPRVGTDDPEDQALKKRTEKLLAMIHPLLGAGVSVQRKRNALEELIELFPRLHPEGLKAVVAYAIFERLSDDDPMVRVVVQEPGGVLLPYAQENLHEGLDLAVALRQKDNAALQTVASNYLRAVQLAFQQQPHAPFSSEFVQTYKDVVDSITRLVPASALAQVPDDADTENDLVTLRELLGFIAPQRASAIRLIAQRIKERQTAADEPRRPSLPRQWREGGLGSLQSDPPELLIIGGGAIGCSVAAHSAQLGLKCVLVEKGDIAAGTSGNSTGLAHAGLRYLKQKRLGYVFRESRARQLLQKYAPHLVRPFSFIFPVYDGDPDSLMKIHWGTVIYDLFTQIWCLIMRQRPPPRHRLHPSAVLREQIPPLKADGLQGGAEYFVDARLWDSRYTLALAQQAVDYGARIIPHASVQQFLSENGELTGVSIQDELADPKTRYDIRAPLIINATGPWIDEIRHLADPDLPGNVVQNSKGIHLIVDRIAETPLIFSSQIPGRYLFILPGDDGTSIIGTTDERYDAPADEVGYEDEEMVGLVREVLRIMPGLASSPEEYVAQHVHQVYWGLRPLVRRGGGTLQAPRDPALIKEADERLWSLPGVKLTASLDFGEKVARDAYQKLRRRRPPRVPREQLPGGRFEDYDAMLIALQQRYESQGWSPETIAHLFSVYGTRTEAIIHYASADARLRQEILPGQKPWILAEVTYAVDREIVWTLSDFLWRRTRWARVLHTLEESSQERLLQAVAHEIGRYLDWDRDEIQNQIAAFRTEYRAHRVDRNGHRNDSPRSTPRQAAVTAGLLAAVGIALATFGWPFHHGLARAAVFAAAMVVAGFGAGYAVAGYRGTDHDGPKANRDPPRNAGWLEQRRLAAKAFFKDFGYAFRYGRAPIAELENLQYKLHAQDLRPDYALATRVHEGIHWPIEFLIHRWLGSPTQWTKRQTRVVHVIRAMSEIPANLLTTLSLPFLWIAAQVGALIALAGAWLASRDRYPVRPVQTAQPGATSARVEASQADEILNRPETTPLKDWQENHAIQLRNIKGPGAIRVQRTNTDPSLCRLAIDRNNTPVGYLLVGLHEDRLAILDINLSIPDEGLGSTLFNWLSWQALNENKKIHLCLVSHSKIVHFAFKYLTNVKVLINDRWEIKTEKETIAMMEKDIVKPPEMREGIFIEGVPKPIQVLHLIVTSEGALNPPGLSPDWYPGQLYQQAQTEEEREWIATQLAPAYETRWLFVYPVLLAWAKAMALLLLSPVLHPFWVSVRAFSPVTVSGNAMALAPPPSFVQVLKTLVFDPLQQLAERRLIHNFLTAHPALFQDRSKEPTPADPSAQHPLTDPAVAFAQPFAQAIQKSLTLLTLLLLPIWLPRAYARSKHAHAAYNRAVWRTGQGPLAMAAPKNPRRSHKPKQRPINLTFDQLVETFNSILDHREAIGRQLARRVSSFLLKDFGQSLSQLYKDLNSSEGLLAQTVPTFAQTIVVLNQLATQEGFASWKLGSFDLDQLFHSYMGGIDLGRIQKSKASLRRSAHIMLDYFIFIQLTKLSLRIWDGDARQASERLRTLGNLLERLQTGPGASGQTFIRDAAYLFTLGSSAYAQDVVRYIETSNFMSKSLGEDEELRSRLGRVFILGVHLWSQQTKEWKERFASRRTLRGLRNVNDIDYLLLVDDVAFLAQRYERLLREPELNSQSLRRQIAEALLGVFAADPEFFTDPVVFAQEVKNLCKNGPSVSKLPKRLIKRFLSTKQPYPFFDILGRVGKVLLSDWSRLDPRALAYSPLGQIATFPQHFMDRMLLLSLMDESFQNYTFDDAFVPSRDWKEQWWANAWYWTTPMMEWEETPDPYSESWAIQQYQQAHMALENFLSKIQTASAHTHIPHSTPRQAAITAMVIAALGFASLIGGWPSAHGLSRAAVLAVALILTGFGAGYSVAGYRRLDHGPKAPRDPPSGIPEWLKPVYRVGYFFLDFWYALWFGAEPIASLEDGHPRIHAQGMPLHYQWAARLHEHIHIPFFEALIRWLYRSEDPETLQKNRVVRIIRGISEFPTNLLTTLALPFLWIASNPARLFLASVIWQAYAVTLLRPIFETLHPLQHFFSLFVFSTLISIGLFAGYKPTRANRQTILSRETLKPLIGLIALTGLLIQVAGCLCFSFPLKFDWVSTAEYSFIFSLTFVVTGFLARLFFGQRFTWKTVAGALAMTIGIGAVAFGQPTAEGPAALWAWKEGFLRWAGFGLIGLATFFFSMGNIFAMKVEQKAKQSLGENHPVYQNLGVAMNPYIYAQAASVMALLWGLFRPTGKSFLDVFQWHPYVLIASVAFTLGWVVFYHSIKRLPVSTWAPLQASTPIWVLFITAWPSLPPLVPLAGALIALVGAYLASRDRGNAQGRTREPTVSQPRFLPLNKASGCLATPWEGILLDRLLPLIKETLGKQGSSVILDHVVPTNIPRHGYMLGGDIGVTQWAARTAPLSSSNPTAPTASSKQVDPKIPDDFIRALTLASDFGKANRFRVFIGRNRQDQTVLVIRPVFDTEIKNFLLGWLPSSVQDHQSAWINLLEQGAYADLLAQMDRSGDSVWQAPTRIQTRNAQRIRGCLAAMCVPDITLSADMTLRLKDGTESVADAQTLSIRHKRFAEKWGETHWKTRLSDAAMAIPETLWFWSPLGLCTHDFLAFALALGLAATFLLAHRLYRDPKTGQAEPWADTWSRLLPTVGLYVGYSAILHHWVSPGTFTLLWFAGMLARRIWVSRVTATRDHSKIRLPRREKVRGMRLAINPPPSSRPPLTGPAYVKGRLFMGGSSPARGEEGFDTDPMARRLRWRPLLAATLVLGLVFLAPHAVHAAAVWTQVSTTLPPLNWIAQYLTAHPLLARNVTASAYTAFWHALYNLLAACLAAAPLAIKGRRPRAMVTSPAEVDLLGTVINQKGRLSSALKFIFNNPKSCQSTHDLRIPPTIVSHTNVLEESAFVLPKDRFHGTEDIALMPLIRRVVDATLELHKGWHTQPERYKERSPIAPHGSLDKSLRRLGYIDWDKIGDMDFRIWLPQQLGHNSGLVTVLHTELRKALGELGIKTQRVTLRNGDEQIQIQDFLAPQKMGRGVFIGFHFHLVPITSDFLTEPLLEGGYSPYASYFPAGSMDPYLESSALSWDDVVDLLQQDYRQLFNQLSFNVLAETSATTRANKTTGWRSRKAFKMYATLARLRGLSRLEGRLLKHYATFRGTDAELQDLIRRYYLDILDPARGESGALRRDIERALSLEFAKAKSPRKDAFVGKRAGPGVVLLEPVAPQWCREALQFLEGDNFGNTASVKECLAAIRERRVASRIRFADHVADPSTIRFPDGTMGLVLPSEWSLIFEEGYVRRIAQEAKRRRKRLITDDIRAALVSVLAAQLISAVHNRATSQSKRVAIKQEPPIEKRLPHGLAAGTWAWKKYHDMEEGDVPKRIFYASLGGLLEAFTFFLIPLLRKCWEVVVGREVANSYVGDGVFALGPVTRVPRRWPGFAQLIQEIIGEFKERHAGWLFIGREKEPINREMAEKRGLSWEALQKQIADAAERFARPFKVWWQLLPDLTLGTLALACLVGLWIHAPPLLLMLYAVPFIPLSILLPTLSSAGNHIMHNILAVLSKEELARPLAMAAILRRAPANGPYALPKRLRNWRIVRIRMPRYARRESKSWSPVTIIWDLVARAVAKITSSFGSRQTAIWGSRAATTDFSRTNSNHSAASRSSMRSLNFGRRMTPTSSSMSRSEVQRVKRLEILALRTDRAVRLLRSALMKMLVSITSLIQLLPDLFARLADVLARNGVALQAFVDPPQQVTVTLPPGAFLQRPQKPGTVGRRHALNSDLQVFQAELNRNAVHHEPPLIDGRSLTDQPRHVKATMAAPAAVHGLAAGTWAWDKYKDLEEGRVFKRLWYASLGGLIEAFTFFLIPLLRKCWEVVVGRETAGAYVGGGALALGPTPRVPRPWPGFAQLIQEIIDEFMGRHVEWLFIGQEKEPLNREMAQKWGLSWEALQQQIAGAAERFARPFKVWWQLLPDLTLGTLALACLVGLWIHAPPLLLMLYAVPFIPLSILIPTFYSAGAHITHNTLAVLSREKFPRPLAMASQGTNMEESAPIPERSVQETLAILENNFGRDTDYLREKIDLTNALDTLSTLKPRKVLIVGQALRYLPVALAVMGVEALFVDHNRRAIRQTDKLLSLLQGSIIKPTQTFVGNIDSLEPVRDKQDYFDVVLMLSLIGGAFVGSMGEAVSNAYYAIRSGGIIFLPNMPSPWPRTSESITMEEILRQLSPASQRNDFVPPIETHWDRIDHLSLGFWSTNHAYTCVKPSGMPGSSIEPAELTPDASHPPSSADASGLLRRFDRRLRAAA